MVNSKFGKKAKKNKNGSYSNFLFQKKNKAQKKKNIDFVEKNNA